MVNQLEYQRIQIARSDGQDTGPGYWPAPTDTDSARNGKRPGATLEKTPRLKPHMLRLAEDDARFIEWRIKLGILLKQELAQNPQEGSSWYVEFPRGYWLYEKSKHLWVSGYPSKSKLFKSPQEFGIHLLWLISGSTDSNDCCCIHCNPPKILVDIGDVALAESKATTLAPRLTTPTTSSSATKPSRDKATKSVAPTPTPMQSTVSQSSVVPTPAPASPVALSQTPDVAPVNSSCPPQPSVTESVLAPFDQNTSSTFFRIGELVWFQVLPSWRIGLIARADYLSNQFDILPISHRLFNQNQLQSKAESELRPFLAFTVPPVSLPELQGKSFDSAPWDAISHVIAAEPHRRESILLDASKMAALKISQSYSLFSHLSDPVDNRKTGCRGLFLGAERLEVGDAIRVRISPSQNPTQEWLDALLGLREIWAAPTMPTAVSFKGDLYVTLTGDEVPPLGAFELTSAQLPAALKEEATFRDKVNPATRWRVALLRQGVVLREDDVRGRFYPSNRLLPVLAHPDLQSLQRELSEGKVRESARQLNQRMDTLKDEYIGMKRNRMEVIGDAVPHGSDVLFAYETDVIELVP